MVTNLKSEQNKKKETKPVKLVRSVGLQVTNDKNLYDNQSKVSKPSLARMSMSSQNRTSSVATSSRQQKKQGRGIIFI